jgi:hypothetical protein
MVVKSCDRAALAPAGGGPAQGLDTERGGHPGASAGPASSLDVVLLNGSPVVRGVNDSSWIAIAERTVQPSRHVGGNHQLRLA